MAERGSAKGGSAGGTGTLSRKGEESGENTGTTRLKEELEDYIEARLSLMLQGMGHGLGEGARKLGDMSTGALTATASHAKDALVDKAKGATGKAKDVVGEKAGDVMEKAKDAGGKGGGKHPEGGTGKGHTIIEDIDVGVPVREAYDQWTQFQEFERFAKGVVSVEQKDDTTTQWHVKVAKSNRHWRGNIIEQVPDERIAWTSEGEKATTRGVVTFHPLAENLTKVLLVLEYFPKGLFEKVGGLFRAQGRRARLDLKLYRTFVMMRGEATGSWRGEIREGEVQEPEDADDTEDAEDRYDEDEDEATDEDEDEDEDDEEPEEDEEPEAEYADDTEEDEQPGEAEDEDEADDGYAEEDEDEDEDEDEGAAEDEYDEEADADADADAEEDADEDADRRPKSRSRRS